MYLKYEQNNVFGNEKDNRETINNVDNIYI